MAHSEAIIFDKYWRKTSNGHGRRCHPNCFAASEATPDQERSTKEGEAKKDGTNRPAIAEKTEKRAFMATSMMLFE